MHITESIWKFDTWAAKRGHIFSRSSAQNRGKPFQLVRRNGYYYSISALFLSSLFHIGRGGVPAAGVDDGLPISPGMEEGRHGHPAHGDEEDREQQNPPAVDFQRLMLEQDGQQSQQRHEHPAAGERRQAPDDPRPEGGGGEGHGQQAEKTRHHQQRAGRGRQQIRRHIHGGREAGPVPFLAMKQGFQAGGQVAHALDAAHQPAEPLPEGDGPGCRLFVIKNRAIGRHDLPAGQYLLQGKLAVLPEGLGMPAVLGDARPAEGEAGAAHQAGQAAVIPRPVEKPHEQQPVHRVAGADGGFVGIGGIPVALRHIGAGAQHVVHRGQEPGIHQIIGVENRRRVEPIPIILPQLVKEIGRASCRERV